VKTKSKIIAIIPAIFAWLLTTIAGAYGQWIVTGTTVGGGNLIVGNGSSLGPLSQTTNPALSSGGVDNVTLNPGSTATASSTDTLFFITSNNTLLSSGTVVGEYAAFPGGIGFNAISFFDQSSAGLSGETVTNNGCIIGGSGGSVFRIGGGGSGGTGIHFKSPSNITDISLNNNGSTSGGNGDFGSYEGSYGAGGNGGGAIDFNSSANISNITLTNYGTAYGGDGGYGYFYSGGGGGNGGEAINFNSSGNISNISLANYGTASGGDGAVSGGEGGSAIGFISTGSISNISLTNNGSLISGDFGNAIDFNSSGNISDISVTNNGSVIGGSCYLAASGIQFYASGSSSNITINNYNTVAGGFSSSGVVGVTADNVTINNWGTISQMSNAGASIAVNGVNNTINLLGHSTVVGPIEASGSNNILNFAFSDVTPRQNLDIQKKLTPYLNGLVCSGSAIILGGTYTWNSFIIQLNLNVINNGLQVTINPPSAVSVGAKWQVDGGPWQRSGAMISELSVGSHTISFNAVNGWVTPNIQTVTVSSNLITSASANYATYGNYSVDFNPDVFPLWDISGEYTADIGEGIGLDFNINEDSSGKINGIGKIIVTGTDISVTGNATVTGIVKSSGSNSLVSLTFSATSGSGTAVVDKDGTIHDVTFVEMIKLNCVNDNATKDLKITGGSSSAKLMDLATGKKFSKSTKIALGASLSLPKDATGGWNLILHLAPNESKYLGSATVQTSNGVSVPLTATGSYNANLNSSAITLKGAGGSMSMVVSLTGSNIMTVQSVKGKLFGQSLNYRAP